jgi:virulence factor Mce-like protein
MRRRGSSSIAANPVLIGAATVLVVVVAVFLAYNANSGLPFVPTYALKVDVPNAANLVEGNEVRVGGARVGVVERITPVNHTDGSVTARLAMKLETTIKPLPKDSTIVIRSKSALGLKYVEITKGRSSQGYPDGGTIPITASKPKQVEFDEVLGTFDERTRQASRSNLNEFGAAFAGRGNDLNQALQDLNPALRSLVPVMRNLSRPTTKLAGLFRALGSAAAQVAPVAETQASMFANLDTTFGALAKVARPQIQDSITGGVPAQDAAIKGLPVQRPFLLNTERFFADLRPGVRSLRTAAPILTSALVVGTGTLQRSLALNRRLKPTFQALQRFAEDPLVALGVKDLSNTARILDPPIAYLAPTQTVCNYATIWFRNVSSLLSVGDANGTGQRFIIVATPQGPNNEGGPSSHPANGPNNDNYLHSNPYPNTAAPGQTRECEAANEPYVAGKQVIGNVPGNQGTSTEITKVDRSR